MVNEQVENMIDQFLKEIWSGELDNKLAARLEKILLEDEESRIKFAEIILKETGKNMYIDIFLYSYLLDLFKLPDILKSFMEYVLENEQLLGWQSLYWIFCQFQRITFMNKEFNLPELDALRWNILNKSYERLKEKLDIELKYIPYEDRREDMAIVLTNQFLDIGHGPTKTAIDRAVILKKRYSNVLMINTADISPVIGAIPFWNGVQGNYVDKYREYTEIEWDGNLLQFVQCENNMPDIDTMVVLIEEIKNIKPKCIISIGGTSILTGLVNEMIPVLTVGCTQSGLMPTLADYQIIEPQNRDYCEEVMKLMKMDCQHLIDGRFTFLLKEQTRKFNKKELGLHIDFFYAVVVGGRLSEELTEEFMEIISSVIQYNDKFQLVIIGDCDKTEKWNKDNILKDHIVYLGKQDDVLAILEHCNLYLNPLRKGGGTSAVEAMEKGLPVISIDYGDVANIVGESFICSNKNEYIKLILRYIDDIEFYNNQSEKAKKLAEELQDSASEFNRILGVFHERINQR